MHEDVLTADTGTSAILHGMLGTLSEVLGGLERRLDAMEATIAAGHDASAVRALEAKVAALADMLHATLGGAVERLDARAVETDEALASGLRAALDRLGELAADVTALRSAPPPLDGEAVTAALGALGEDRAAVREMLADLDAAVSGLAERREADASAVAELAGAMRAQAEETRGRLDEQDTALREIGEALVDVAAAAAADRTAVLVEEMAGLRRAVTESAEDGELAEALRRLQFTVESDHIDLRGIHEAMEAVQAQTARTVADGVSGLLQVVEEQRTTVGEGFFDMAARQSAMLEALDRVAVAAVDARPDTSEVARALAEVREALEKLAAVEGVGEVVRRESELLTQRVAALSVAVESLRALLSAHIDETANSLSRKATEVGRKLATDLGIRPKKPPARGAAQLGRGDS